MFTSRHAVRMHKANYRLSFSAMQLKCTKPANAYHSQPCSWNQNKIPTLYNIYIKLYDAPGKKVENLLRNGISSWMVPPWATDRRRNGAINLGGKSFTGQNGEGENWGRGRRGPARQASVAVSTDPCPPTTRRNILCNAWTTTQTRW